MVKGLIRISGLMFIVMIMASLGAVPATMVYGSTTTPVSSQKGYVNVTITYNQTIDLAYTVRNITMPIANWSMNQNITLAKFLLKRGDTLLEKAINISSTNASRAKALAFIAAVVYGHEVITAYPVLGKTIRENLGVNGTITNDTVNAVIDKARELETVLDEAINVASNMGLTVPSKVDILKTVATGYINTSIVLLDKGYVKAALHYAVRAYHTYVKAYGLLVKATFIIKLDLPRRFDEPLTPRIVAKKVSKKLMEMVASRLPPWIRRDIMKKIKNGEIKTWEDLVREVRKDVIKFRHWFRNKTVVITAGVLMSLIFYIEYKLTPDNETYIAVTQWLQDHGFLRSVTPLPVIDVKALKQYLIEFVSNVSDTYNVSGIDLIFKSVEELGDQISDETGIEVDLMAILHEISTYYSGGIHGGHQGHHGHWGWGH